MAVLKPTTQGRWVTIRGARVYIGAGGKIEKGPPDLVAAAASGPPSEYAERARAAGIRTSDGKPESLKDYPPAKYGYWVAPDGTTIAVDKYQGHKDVARKVGDAEHKPLQHNWVNMQGGLTADGKPTGTQGWNAHALEWTPTHLEVARRVAEVYHDSGQDLTVSWGDEEKGYGHRFIRKEEDFKRGWIAFTKYGK